MSFLLLLSAMLSALTGAVASARVEPAQATVCACVGVREARIVRAVPAGMRPDAGPLWLPVSIDAPALMLAIAEPLFASRRRE